MEINGSKIPTHTGAKNIGNLKVVTAQEMARIEQWALEQGASQLEFMRQAGMRVAEAAFDWVQLHLLSKKALLLVWKGNKGGDAFAAGVQLLEKGFEVRAILLVPIEQCSESSRHFAEIFFSKGGTISHAMERGNEAILIDGLLGTGFTGKADGILKKAIEFANDSGLPILSIDIPSGLNGSTGEIDGVAIQASLTVTLGLPKIGLFLQNGVNYTGKLLVGDFGLAKEAAEQVDAAAYWMEKKGVKELLPPILRNRHKYQAGLVVGFAGSPGMVGAAKLASFAALRAGAGIVKWFYTEEVAEETVDTAVEVIRVPWSQEAWEKSAKKANALFIGPGLGQSEERRDQVAAMLSHITSPVVLDADALFSKTAIPKRAICTPHRGEMLRLLGEAHLEEDKLLKRCQMFSDQTGAVLVLKGAPTWIFIPHEKPILMARGDPGMATAGSGDVLTGILAALLAQGCSEKHAAQLGVFLHALAGEAAAREKTSYCLVASDLINYLPMAFKQLLEERW